MPNQTTVEAVNRITKLMTLYPIVYVILTLPLAAGRMWSMSHHGEPYSDVFAIIAGAMLTSCGWVDTLLYTLTRKALLHNTMPGHGNSNGRANHDGPGNSWEEQELGTKGITHTRTVTVEDGILRDNCDESDSAESAESTQRGRPLTDSPSFFRDPSPHGSIDPILSGKAGGNRIKTEISVGLQEMPGESEKSSDSRTSTSFNRGRG